MTVKRLHSSAAARSHVLAHLVAVQPELVALEGHRIQESTAATCIPEVEGGRPRQMAGAAPYPGGMGAALP
jgi:hypothetical protein